MGLFSSALSGAIRGAQEMVLLDTFDRYQDEINVLNEYVNLLSFGANYYRALAEGQTVVAVRDYGNYHAAREIMKKYCNMYPEDDKDFIPLKRKFATEIAKKKYAEYNKIMVEHGHDKAYASINEIRNNKMDFITLEEVISEAMADPDQNNQNPSADTNYVSPFGPFPSKEEKKKEKSSSWFFGKK